ncbi:MAG: dihydrodipicolinate synthase family protein [Rhizomicrobium sp.]
MAIPHLYSAVPTPLDAALRIAVAPLAQYCKTLLSQGCGGVVLFGTTGEGTFFSVPEKLAALQDIIAEGVPPERIILASGACALDGAAAMVMGAGEAGCSAALVLPPFFTKQTDDEGLADWFDALIARAGSDAGILLYHIPAVAGVGFSPDLVSRLFDRHADIMRGVKDSSADSALARELARRGLPGVHVSTEVGLTDNLAAGMQGTISASLNITLPFVLRALAGSSSEADATAATIRAHLIRHSLIWAVKTVLFTNTGDIAWSRLAPPHRAPQDRKAFLQELYQLQSAGEP